MSLLVLLGIAIGLGMDAFAVSIATGVKLCRVSFWQTVRMAGAFGLFQFGMPIVGWLGASRFVHVFQAVDHWIAFGLLLLVGLHMIWESRQGSDKKWKTTDPTRGWLLLSLAIATSIDALAIGISFSMLNTPILAPAILIGVVAFVMSILGLQLGCRFGLALGEKMELLGGCILIGIGIKILLEHLM
jgi:manganese efflux pump family protein